jgi:quercetin 2,3-dioxygenase
MKSLPIRRRSLLLAGSGAAALSALGCLDPNKSQKPHGKSPLARLPGSEASVVEQFALGSRWKTFDPFLFCVHHEDAYPKANLAMGPAASLAGRELGSDFAGKDGWRMYHGDAVPGFPRHPHRGFETVTVTRQGLIDHSDSMGATARYGFGDVQWMTAGKGIVHAEMFPLLEQAEPNPAELFQIWLNLPRRDKFVDPHFTMFWKDDIPEVTLEDDRGRKSVVRVIAGQLAGKQAPKPPPNSFASREEAELAVWSIRMQAGARLRLSAPAANVDRTMYFFRGTELSVDGRAVTGRSGLRLLRGAAVELVAGSDEVELLLLQGRPIGEPVAQRGPFVMNEERELQQAWQDYRKDQFGGWPWGSTEPVHPREEGRFAVHADGRRERGT